MGACACGMGATVSSEDRQHKSNLDSTLGSNDHKKWALIDAAEKHRWRASRSPAMKAADMQSLAAALSDAFDDIYSEYITPIDIAKLADNGCNCFEQLRVSVLRAEIYSLGLTEGCLVYLQEQFQSHLPVYVKSAQYQRRIHCFEVVDGKLDIEQLAEVYRLHPQHIYIVSGDQRYHLTVDNLYDIVKTVRSVPGQASIGSCREAAISIDGIWIAGPKMLPSHEWLLQPICDPPGIDSQHVPVHDVSQHTGMAVDCPELWQEFEPGVQSYLTRLKSCWESSPDAKQYHLPFERPLSNTLPVNKQELRDRFMYKTLIEVNNVLASHNCDVLYRAGGCNRPASFSDMVLQVRGEIENEALSKLIVGVGNVHLKLPNDKPFEEALRVPEWQQELEAALRQVHGNATMDNTTFFFLFNQHVVFFFKRVAGNISMKLKVSPPVRLDGSGKILPLAAFAFFAEIVAECLAHTQLSARAAAALSPGSSNQGSGSNTGQGSPGVVELPDALRQSNQWLVVAARKGLQDLSQLPVVTLNMFGYSDDCIGGDSITRVFKVWFDNKPAAMKVYDARHTKSFMKEVLAYLQLNHLQDRCIGRLLAVARLYETGCVVLLIERPAVVEEYTGAFQKAALASLTELHNAGALLGDIQPANLLVCGDGQVWFSSLQHCNVRTEVEGSDDDAFKQKSLIEINKLMKCRL